MDKRNEYRTRKSGYPALPVELEFRAWRKPWSWLTPWKLNSPGEWRSLSIYKNDAEALVAAQLHAALNTPVDIKYLGRLP